MAKKHKVTPNLWFPGNAQEAIDFYSGIFDVKVKQREDYPEGSYEGASGLMTAVVKLEGRRYVFLNAGPEFPFTEAFSLVVDCKDAEEVDYYWDALLADGGEPSQCGWLKDRFGLSWQVVPRQLTEYLHDEDPAKRKAVMEAMLQMQKIDVAALDAAYALA